MSLLAESFLTYLNVKLLTAPIPLPFSHATCTRFTIPSCKPKLAVIPSCKPKLGLRPPPLLPPHRPSFEEALIVLGVLCSAELRASHRAMVRGEGPYGGVHGRAKERQARSVMMGDGGDMGAGGRAGRGRGARHFRPHHGPATMVAGGEARRCRSSCWERGRWYGRGDRREGCFETRIPRIPLSFSPALKQPFTRCPPPPLLPSALQPFTRRGVLLLSAAGLNEAPQSPPISPTFSPYARRVPLLLYASGTAR